MTRTKKTLPTSTSIDLTSRQLRDAITLVKPFIGTDDCFPTLLGYRLAVIDGDLYVSGTDRYTMATVRVPGAEDEPFPAGFVGFLPSSLAARALQLFGGGDRKALPVLLTVRIDGEWVSIENRPSDVTEPPTRLVAKSHGKNDLDHLALLRKVVVEWRESSTRSDGIPVLGLNPAFTARLAVVQKLMGNGQYVTARITARNKPVLFTAGEDFIALQMPVRLSDNASDEIAAWEPRLAEKPAKKKPRAAKAKSA